jgi:hypothetical protein
MTLDPDERRLLRWIAMSTTFVALLFAGWIVLFVVWAIVRAL